MISKVKTMANPFAYEEYRKDKIRQKIEESRVERVQLKVTSLSVYPTLVFFLSKSSFIWDDNFV